MKNFRVGIHVAGTSSGAIIDRIVQAEQAGIDCVWMNSGGVAADPLVVFGAAAMKTQKILLGTAVVPTFPRHPLALVQGALAVEDLAPGRLRLGVGPSHKPFIEPTYGIAFDKPLEHLREYLTVLRSILYEGSVDFDGKRIIAHAKLPGPSGVTVLASALRENGFRLCGELADGAISWMCPLSYLRDAAVPAMQEGARLAGRSPPPLIAHVPVIVSEDVDAVRVAAREQFGFYPKIPYYSQMLQDAGFAEARNGEFSDRMINAIVVHGSAAQVEERVRAVPSFGAGELLATVVQPKGDAQAFARTATVLGRLAAE